MDEATGSGAPLGVRRLPAQETRKDQPPRNRRKQDRCAVPERDVDNVIGRAMKRDDRRARSPRGATDDPARARRRRWRAGLAPDEERRADPQARGDRKSVGEGTTVSVRVDIGCRRIITKKTHHKKILM